MNNLIRILGHDYKLSYIKGLVLKEDSLGRCCSNSLEIEIEDDLCKQNKQSVLIHEILEAINYRLDLELEHNKLQALSSGLYQVFNDNNLIKDLV